MENQPKISITIPCRNEEKYIERCLMSIVNCDYDKSNLSVFVCDGMSNDKTREIVKSISEEHTFIQLLDNPDQTTPFALNIGLRKDGFDIKIILGAHAEIDKQYLTKTLEIYQLDDELGCVGGVLENAYEDKASSIIGMAMSSPFGVGNAHFRTGAKAGYVDTVAFGAYKSEVFQKIGFFDEELIRNQDDEFNYRLLKNGFKIYLSPEIKAKYFVRASYGKLFKQYRQYGYWKVFVNKKHKSITTWRQLIPALFVSYILLGAVLSICFKALIIPYVLGLFLYIGVAKLFAFKMSRKFSEFTGIVFSFFILHLSYGLGYLEGILQFLILNKKPTKKSARLTR